MTERNVRRIFLAIDFSPDCKEEVCRNIEALNLHYIHFVPKENLHLTLRWFGDMTDEEIEKVSSALLPLTEEETFEATLEGLDLFRNRNRNPILWIGFGKGIERLVSLYHRVNHLLGIEEGRNERNFSPHVTISRIRSHKLQNKSFMRLVNNSSTLLFGKTLIGEIALYESVHEGNGRKYLPLKRFPLKS